MKRVVSVLLLMVLVFSFVGCSKKEDTASKTDNAAAPTSSAPATGNDAKPTGTAAATSDNSGKKLVIGLSMPTFAEERWSVDTKAIEDYCKEKGFELTEACADGDSNKQKEQCSTMFTKGINVLIIAPNDGNAAASIVEEAKKDGIYVISYDRLVTGTDKIDAYITFNSWYMGQLNGKYIVDQLKAKNGDVKGNVVLLKGDPGDSCAPLYFGGAYEQLKPFVDSGALNVISTNDCIGWKPEEATKHVENAMSIADAKGIKIDAILCPNDGTASGAIAALGDDIAKQTIITGMDAEAAACQRILAGTQSMTSWGDTRKMGRTAVDIAQELFTTGTYKTSDTSEGTDAAGNKIKVPTCLLEVTFIDKSNVDILIEEGYHKKEDIYGK